MFKFTSNGLEEFGEPIELTEEDMETLKEIIEESSKHPTSTKQGGKWVQNNIEPSIERGYRIYEKLKEDGDKDGTDRNRS